MEVIKKAEGAKLELTVIGRLDTTTAPALENVIKERWGKVGIYRF